MKDKPGGWRAENRELNPAGLLRAFGPRLLAEVAVSLLLGRRRSIASDAARAVSRLPHPPMVEGIANIPQRGPFALVANHYQAPGLWVGLVAAAITNAVVGAREDAGEVRWLTLSEFRWFQVGRHWVANPVTSLLFPRVAAAWGLIPTPARPSEVAGRARALRRILAYLSPRDGHLPEPVALFPEGHATVVLEEGLPGSGAFLHRVSNHGTPLLPVGVHHREGRLAIRFGETFFLEKRPPEGQDLDVWARRQVMGRVAMLLPESLRGVHGGGVERGL